MPELRQPPTIQEVDLQNEAFILEQELEKAQALSLVNQTFYQFEQYRSQAHDPRWIENDNLYAGNLPQRYWPGSRIPRSNVPMQIVFDQIESALPAIMSALFNNGDNWFEVVAEDGTPAQDAKMVQNALEYCFEHPKSDFGSTVRQEINFAVKQILQHGNGGVHCYWDVKLDRPVAEWVDLRDMYFDPGACTPDLDEHRAVIRRKRMTVQEILDFKADPRMNVPSHEQLWAMASTSNAAQGDQTKAAQESSRGVSYTPGATDWVPNPVDSKVEVHMYYSRTRIIFTINRQWVLFNGPNPYSFIPFCFAPCYTFLGRAYAMSIGDVQGANQRVIEGYINAHRDEMALRIHPPRVSPRGAVLSPQENKFGPGADFRVDDPSKDIQLLYPQGGMTNVFQDIAYFQSVADARTGITALGSGVPRPSNANRTASGMQMQMNGSANRLSSIVQNIEDFMITPLLYKMFRLKQFHLRPEQTVPGQNSQGGVYQVPATVFQKKMAFRMFAASRMLSREKLLSMVPIFAQYLFQGPFIEGMHKIGKTVNVSGFWDMVQEATGIKGRFDLIQNLTPQEMQGVQQNSPAAVEQQKAQMESQTKLQIASMQSQTELQKAQIAKQPDPAEMVMLEQELKAEQQRMAMEAEQMKIELFMKQMMEKLKLDAAREKHAMDREKAQFDAQVKAQESQQGMVQSQMSHQLQMQQMIENAKAQREAAKIAPQKGQAGRPATAAGQPNTKKKSSKE